MTKIAIIGAAGRMGKALIRCAPQFSRVEIVAAIEQAGAPAVGQDTGLLAGVGRSGMCVTDDPKAIEQAEVLIDFTFHTAVPANVKLAADMKKAVVIGTTGLADSEISAVRLQGARIPILMAPNMSLGVNLLFALAERAATVLGLDYDVEIVETHHRNKKDAPSGTALRLGEKVAKGRGQDLKSIVTFGREGMVGERPQGQIGIHAVRGGDIVGDHTVLFVTDGERVEFSHRATSRDAFATGALRAALWLAGRKPGFYDMQDVLGL